MGVRRYQDLECWQLANELKKRVYALCRRPEVAKDVKFCDQMRDSARGGPRAIAEGFGRFRPKEFARYLEYARASLIETQNHIGDALDSDYLTQTEHDELFAFADLAIGKTTKLHRYLNRRP